MQTYTSKLELELFFSGTLPCIKLGFHIRGKRKRLAAAARGCGMRYANDLIPYTFTHAFALSFPERLQLKKHIKRRKYVW